MASFSSSAAAADRPPVPTPPRSPEEDDGGAVAPVEADPCATATRTAADPERRGAGGATLLLLAVAGAAARLRALATRSVARAARRRDPQSPAPATAAAATTTTTPPPPPPAGMKAESAQQEASYNNSHGRASGGQNNQDTAAGNGLLENVADATPSAEEKRDADGDDDDAKTVPEREHQRCEDVRPNSDVAVTHGNGSRHSLSTPNNNSTATPSSFSTTPTTTTTTTILSAQATVVADSARPIPIAQQAALLTVTPTATDEHGGSSSDSSTTTSLGHSDSNNLPGQRQQGHVSVAAALDVSSGDPIEALVSLNQDRSGPDPDPISALAPSIEGTNEQELNATSSYASGLDIPYASSGSGFDRVPSTSTLDKWSNPHTLSAPHVDLARVGASANTVRDIGLAQDLCRAENGFAQHADRPRAPPLDAAAAAATPGEPAMESFDEFTSNGLDYSGTLRDRRDGLAGGCCTLSDSPWDRLRRSTSATDHPLRRKQPDTATADGRLRRTASLIDERILTDDDEQEMRRKSIAGEDRQFVIHDVNLPEEKTNLWVVGQYIIPW